MAKEIAGNVYWIENGRQTTKLVDAEAAFSDPDEAKAQVQFAEASGDKKQIRLARLAFRQYQGMRYRGDTKAKKSTKTKAGMKALGGKGVARKSLKGRPKRK